MLRNEAARELVDIVKGVHDLVVAQIIEIFQIDTLDVRANEVLRVLLVRALKRSSDFKQNSLVVGSDSAVGILLTEPPETEILVASVLSLLE